MHEPIMLAANGAAPTIIKIWPAGEIDFGDGRPPVKLDDAAAARIIAYRQMLGRDIAIDYEHQQDLVGQRGDLGLAPAAGWIKAFEWRAGDGLYAAVEWTERAAAMIAAKEYRYTSPSWAYDKKTNSIQAIVGLGLVNNPATVEATPLVASLNQPGGAGQTKEDEGMDKLKEKLGLPPEATEEEVIAAIGGLSEAKAKLAELEAAAKEAETKAAEASAQAEQTEAHLASMRRGFGLPETASLPEITAHALALKSRPTEDRVKELEVKLASMEEADKKRETAALVDGYIGGKEPKILPAERDLMIQIASATPEAFAGLMKARPVLAHMQTVDVDKSKPASVMTDADREVARQFGLSEEAWKKHNG